MLKLIDLTYHVNDEYNDPLELLKAQKESLGYVDHIKEHLSVSVIKHMNHPASMVINDIRYDFLKGFKKWSGFQTNKYIKQNRPDVVLVQGFIFPLQVIMLRLQSGKKCVIMLQHHGENPSSRRGKILQRIADKYVDAYLFTSKDNAASWLDQKVISSSEKCREIQAASTGFVKQNKSKSKVRCGISGTRNFLWVGRLNDNKDPLTVLNAFGEYAGIFQDARLYMIYQTEELLMQVKKMISLNDNLKETVILKGRVDHDELIHWYSASDFYISGSYRESCGFALLEAMACGCIPVVTNIPSFRKITGNGSYGLLYEAGDSAALLKVLRSLNDMAYEELSASVAEHFKKELSFKSIANNIYSLCQTLTYK